MLQNGIIGVYFTGEYSYTSTWMFLKIELIKYDFMIILYIILCMTNIILSICCSKDNLIVSNMDHLRT